MGWVKIDDAFFRHPKVVSLPAASKLLFVGGLCYCAEQMTDGVLSVAAAKGVAAMIGVSWTAHKPLVDGGLWHPLADPDKPKGPTTGFEVHDYLDYQMSAERERQRRDQTSTRVQRHRINKRYSDDGNAPCNGVTHPAGNGPVTLPPNPNQILLTSPPPLTVVGAPTEAAAFIAAVVETVARRQLAATKTRRQVDSETGWLTIARRNLTALHAETISQAHAFGQTAQDVADRLEPPPKTPVDTTRRDYAHLRPDCPDTPAGCGGSGMILAYDGTAQRCPMCNQAGA